MEIRNAEEDDLVLGRRSGWRRMLVDDLIFSDSVDDLIFRVFNNDEERRMNRLEEEEERENKMVELES